MSDESEPVTAVAKAVEEAAKTGRALVEAGSDLAKFIGKALGTAPEDAVGLLGGDYLHDLRIRNLDKISRKTEEILRDRGVEDPEPIGPKALLPALEAASEETDETLQDMWANLLANAMDPNKDTSLERVFSDTLNKFEPIDALMLQTVLSVTFELAPFTDKQLASILDLRRTQVGVSCARLARLTVLSAEDLPKGRVRYKVAALGTELHLACSPDAAD